MSEVSRPIALEFSRSPVPGRVKTRIAQTEGTVEAARIYRLLAEAVHAPLLEAQAAGLLDVALCTPDGDPAWLPGTRFHFLQGPGDLGARLTRCFEHAFEIGAAPLLCVGTDVVCLDVPFLQRALQALPDLGDDPVRSSHRLPGVAARFEGASGGSAAVAVGPSSW